MQRDGVFRACKQSKWKDDDIAIVNAALRVSLDEMHTVRNVDLAYGGALEKRNIPTISPFRRMNSMELWYCL